MAMTIRSSMLALIVLLGAAGRADAIIADSADDVCAGNADPCNVTETVEVVDEATLDFGTRVVRLTGGGRFDFGAGSGTILCGSFQAESSTAIAADDEEEVEGDTELIVVRARRLCSDGMPPQACIEDADCTLGTCSAGSEASITLGGKIRAGSDNPGTVVLDAADSVTVAGQVSLASRSNGNAGGTLVIHAAAGDVLVQQRLRLRGGSLAAGGNVDIDAGRDVQMAAGVDIEGGGVVGGGTLTILAGRDVSMTSSIKASGKTYFARGGDIHVDAGGDISVGGTKGVKFLSNGHGMDGAGGSGGFFVFLAGGNMTVAPKTRMTLMGGVPDGTGGAVDIDVAGDVTFNAQVIASTPGHDGRGGDFYIGSGGTTTYGPSASVTMAGDANGGLFTIESDGDLNFTGTARLGQPQGQSGDFRLTSGAHVTVAGSVNLPGSGFGNNNLAIEACHITLTETASLANAASEGDNHLLARETMQLLAGSTVSSEGWMGTNILEYRNAGAPPVVSGTVTPAPILVLNESLLPCP
jgi:hypothetical protein